MEPPTPDLDAISNSSRQIMHFLLLLVSSWSMAEMVEHPPKA